MRGLGMGLGLVRRLRGDSDLVPVWFDDNVSDWTPVDVTLGTSAFTDPEVGALAVRVRETATTANHYIAKNIPLVSGNRYRLRFLVRASGRFEISINLPGKYWIGTIGSTVPALAAGFEDMAVETVGSFTALAVEFEHEGATGDVLLSISTCLPGPSTFFLGEVVKGFEVGNVKLYDLGVTPVTVPATAIDVPSGRSLLAAIDAVLAPAGVLGDFWVSMWVRTTSRPHPYLSLFTSVGGGYIWLGADLQWIDPVPGARNLAYFGPNGGHGLGSEYPPLNTWTHHVWSVSGGTVKGWLDKAPITWDAGPTTDGVLGASTWNPVTHLRLLNETGGGQDFIGGARAIAIGKKTGHLTQGEVDDIYEQNAPGTVAGVVMTGMTMLGSWPLATSSDLTSAVAGGPDLVVEGGALGTDVTGPTAITVL